MTAFAKYVADECREFYEGDVLESRIRRSTGTQVVVVRGTLDADSPELRYWTICEGRPGDESHGGLVGHTTRRDAIGWASTPLGWCPVCQEERDDMLQPAR